MLKEIKGYTVDKLIGSGSICEVYRGVRTADQLPVAIKVVDIKHRSDHDVQTALNELRCLCSIEHPHVVALLDAVVDTERTQLSLVMELAEDGTLQDLIDRHRENQTPIPERAIWKAATQLFLALHELKNYNLIHRDVKPANVLVFKGGLLKLCDFHLAVESDSLLYKINVCTPYYTSPEIIEDMRLTFKHDMWAVGVTLYEMCALRHPFHADSIPTLLNNIAYKDYPSIPLGYSSRLSGLVDYLLRKNPKNRLHIRMPL